jgi:hypothetical protein
VGAVHIAKFGENWGIVPQDVVPGGPVSLSEVGHTFSECSIAGKELGGVMEHPLLSTVSVDRNETVHLGDLREQSVRLKVVDDRPHRSISWSCLSISSGAL